MTEQDHHPDLTGLLRGELSNDQVLDAGRHLDMCPSCRGDLAELAVGHALLSSASRRLDAAPRPAPTLRRAAPSRRRRTTVALVAAAAVAVVAGSVLAVNVVGDGSGGQGQAPVAQPPTQVARLLAVDGHGNGSVRMTEDHDQVAMRVETHDLPSAGSGHFYYLWLLDPRTNKMLPLGVISPGGTASFELPASLLGRYQAVDVSLESDDGDPGHSVRSVLRGRYA